MADVGVARARISAKLAIGAFLVSLLFGLLLPVYSDEIGWRFKERAGIDGGLDIMFNQVALVSSNPRS